MIIVAMTITAAWITVATGLFGDPAVVAVVPPILAAVIMTRVPLIRDRLAVVLPLLAIGWFGGVLGLMIVDPRDARTDQRNRRRAWPRPGEAGGDRPRPCDHRPE